MTAPIDPTMRAYLGIADDLRAQIRDGKLKPGDRLPPRTALAKHYGAAPETVKRAQELLAREGLIETRSTRGTYVLAQPPEPEPSPEYLQLMQALEQISIRLDRLESRVDALAHGSSDAAHGRSPDAPDAPADASDH